MAKKIACLVTVLILAFSEAAMALAAGPGGLGIPTLSDQGLKFIEAREGFRPTAYLKANKWFIGYGTRCDDVQYPAGISEGEAEILLTTALGDITASVTGFLSRNTIPVTQNQYDSLVSFTYNLGTGWMDPSNRFSSYLMKGIQNYSESEIVNAIGTWCHSGKKVNDALVSRRLAEANLFLYGDYSGGGSSYVYVVYDAGKGSVEHDIYFYPCGQPYGSLPDASQGGYAFDGWYTSSGDRLDGVAAALNNMTVTARWSAGQAKSFPDVSEGDWYYAYVSDLSKYDIVSGYPDGTFRPGKQVSCAEALKLILLAAGCDEQPVTGDDWAGGYLKLAVGKKWVVSSDIKDLNAAISRQLVARIAAGALGLKNPDLQSPFADTTDQYVLTLYENGIVEGSVVNGALCYQPKNCLTRSELSAIVWRIRALDSAAEPVQPSEPTKPPENINGQIQYGSEWLAVLNGVPVNAYDPYGFTAAGGAMQYQAAGVTSIVGIDVSSYQQTIDWRKVKADGIEFAIIRLGFRGYESGSINLDSCFGSNIQGALDAGLKVGVYFFSQAITIQEALEEADFVLANLSGYELEYPVVFDWEAIGNASARTDGLDIDTLCQCARAFCDRIAMNGYSPMVYFTTKLGYLRYDLSRIMDYKFWFAQYTANPTFYYDFQMWQYTSSGTVDGIQGRVDMNIEFKK
jgi:GH25 family lysozyme M1 (1,4-beta-N-acetylmuramidase)/GH24 family phage-related lysozyme (muramidase)